MTDETTNPENRLSPAKSGWLPLATLLVFTLLVRGGVLVGMRDQLKADPDGYRGIAESVLEHGVYGLQEGGNGSVQPTAFRSPLYPLLLTTVASGNGKVHLMDVVLLHLALGMATVAMVYWLARWWELGRYGWLAAAMVACDPILLNQSTYVMTETLATFLAVLGLLCLSRYHVKRSWWTAGLAGGSLALAMLCRPTFAVWLAMGSIVVLLVAPNWQRRVTSLATYALAVVVVVAPWGVRNYLVLGKPIVTTTHGGFTFALGNNELFYDYLRQNDDKKPWDSAAYQADTALRFGEGNSPDHELTKDRLYYRESLKFVRDRPGMFAYACAYRIGQLWNPLPHPSYEKESAARQRLRYAVCTWYVAIFLLATVGIFSLRGRLLSTPWVWGVLLCLSITAVHAFYWSNMRMRAPLMPGVCLLAAVGVGQLRSFFRRRK